MLVRLRRQLVTPLNVYRSLLSQLSAGGPAVLVTVLRGGAPAATEKILFTPAELGSSDTGTTGEGFGRRDVARSALEAGELRFVRGADGEAVLAEPYYPEPRLIILGGGHIARPLAVFGREVGFQVTVVDDRPLFATRERFPTAVRVLCTPFEECLATLAPNASSCVVIVTRGHRHDLVCLRQALRYPLAYLGMIGSRRRVEGIRRLLAAEGVAENALAQLHAPIGLSIGAVTPAEIAVSIAAQLIAVRRLGRATPGPPAPEARLRCPEFDRSVLEALAGNPDERGAIETVLRTRGSTPRAAGAKMLVWPDGRKAGTIGGGCAEAEAIQAGRQVAVAGGYRIVELDLTEEAAAEEGMVCGGTMEVLVEAVAPAIAAPLSPPL